MNKKKTNLNDLPKQNIIIQDLNLIALQKGIKNTILECWIYYKILMQQKHLAEKDVKDNLNEFFASLKDSNYNTLDKHIGKINDLTNEIESTEVETEKPSSKILSLKDKKVFANNLQLFKDQLASLTSVSDSSLNDLIDDFVIYEKNNFQKIKLLQKKDKTPLALTEVYDLGEEIIDEIQKIVSKTATEFIAK